MTRHLLLLLSLITMSLPLPSAAGNANGIEDRIDTAPVMVDGEVLFIVRGTSGFPASQRAGLILERIKRAAADTGISIGDIVSVEQEDGTRILAGDKLIVQLFDADAAVEGVKLEELTLVNLHAIQVSIERWREMRSGPALLKSSSLAVGATLTFVALVVFMLFGVRRLRALVERHTKTATEGVKVQRVRLIDPDQIRLVLRSFIGVTYSVLILVSGYIWLQVVLGLFPWTRGLASGLLTLVTGPLTEAGAAMLDVLPNLLVVLLVVFITRYLLSLIRVFFRAVDRGRINMESFEAEWAWPTYRIVRVLVIAFALVMAYPYIPGSQSDAFKGVTLFLGLILSLGSSSAVANIIAGYTMTYRRAFRIGDRIRFGDVEGTVEDVRLLVTHIRSLKNEEVVVPNSLILNSSIINFTTLAVEHGLVLHTTVGIGYEVPWRQVEAMLFEAAARTDGLETEQQPFVLVHSLGDYAINYELNVYCRETSQINSLYTALHHSILDVFNEYEVQIMTPSYVADTAEAKLVRPEDWQRPPGDKLAGYERRTNDTETAETKS